jgi:lysophospholipase L1-like esterase
VKKLICLVFALWAPVAAAQAPNDFALQDGDTVVFFGDSNTEWGNYPREIENYTLLRYPDRRIEFINAGVDGDMASKAFFRLERDVFARGANVVVVLFGINDISWGNYAGPEFQKTFLDYTLKIVDACRAKGLKVYVASYPITGSPYGAKAQDPYLKLVYGLTSTDTSSLQRLGDETLRLARQHGALTIDVQREMRRVRDRALKAKFHQEDGVHLNELGNEVLALALLKGFGASATANTVKIDTARKAATNSSGSVSELRTAGDEIQFTRLDKQLPLTFWASVDSSGFSIEKAFAPINSYDIEIAGLDPNRRFDLDVDGILISPKCGFTGKQLAGPLNLAALGSDRWFQRGPWAQQAMALARLTEAKASLYRASAYPSITEIEGSGWTSMQQEIKAALERTTAAQREIARPRPYRFSIKPTVPDASARCRKR